MFDQPRAAPGNADLGERHGKAGACEMVPDAPRIRGRAQAALDREVEGEHHARRHRFAMMEAVGVTGLRFQRVAERMAQIEQRPAAQRLALVGFDDARLACDDALAGASIIINASPLGMAGSPLMPASLLESVAAYARGATLLDMVYKPVRTAFLEVGEANGGIAVDGLAMLVGQARAAFELFFGRPPPAPDRALRDLIAS